MNVVGEVVGRTRSQPGRKISRILFKTKNEKHFLKKTFYADKNKVSIKEKLLIFWSQVF